MKDWNAMIESMRLSNADDQAMRWVMGDDSPTADEMEQACDSKN